MDADERSRHYRSFAAAFRGDPLTSWGIDQEAYTQAFDPAVSRTACSLHESSHTARSQNDLFIELLKWYEHFGLTRSDTAPLPDHISVELEFMHFLTFQEHENRDTAEAVTSLQAAQKDFLTRHLIPLATAIRHACKSNDPACQDLVKTLPVFLAEELDLLNGQTTPLAPSSSR